MTHARMRIIVLAVVVCTCWGAGGCGDDGEPPPDAALDGGEHDASVGGDAREDVGVDAHLNLDATLPTCSVAFAACGDDSYSNDDFLCVPSRGGCLPRCDRSIANQCPVGSACISLVDGENDGVCVNGDCNDACFDPDICVDAFRCFCADAKQFPCDGTTGTCHAMENGASFCLTAGTGVADSPCGQMGGADQCAPGLFCVGGRCTAPCNGVEDCSSEDCLAVLPQTGANQPGVCGVGCTPYSAGECGTDRRCELQFGLATRSLVGSLCVDLLTNPGDRAPLAAPGEPCDLDFSNGVDSQCLEGYVCYEPPASDGGLCTQICDGSGASAEPFAACPAETLEPVWDNTTTAYLSVSGYQASRSLPGGARLDAIDGAAALLSSVSPARLWSGAAYTAVAHLSSTGTMLSLLEDLDVSSSPLTDQAGFRAFNLSSASVDLRIARPIGPQVAQGSSSAWLPVSWSAGDTAFVAGVGSEALLTVVPQAGRPLSASAELLAWGDGTTTPLGLVLFENNPPGGLASTGAAFRVINASSAHSTIDVNGPGGLDDASIDSGSAGAWHVLNIADGTTVNFNVTLSWPAGGSIGVNLSDRARGHIDTIVFWDGPSGINPTGTLLSGVGDPGAADVAIRVTHCSGSSGDLRVAIEEPGVLGMIGSLSTIPPADGVEPIAAEEQAITFRPADAPPTEALTALTAFRTPALGDLWSIFLGDTTTTPGSPAVVVDVLAPAPLLGDLEVGQSFLRFVHLATGVEPLWLRMFVPAQVCAIIESGYQVCLEP